MEMMNVLPLLSPLLMPIRADFSSLRRWGNNKPTILKTYRLARYTLEGLQEVSKQDKTNNTPLQWCNWMPPTARRANTNLRCQMLNLSLLNRLYSHYNTVRRSEGAIGNKVRINSCRRDCSREQVNCSKSSRTWSRMPRSSRISIRS